MKNKKLWIDPRRILAICAAAVILAGAAGSALPVQAVTTPPKKTGTEETSESDDTSKKTAEADVAAPAATGLCQGKTKNGEPCKRKAKAGSKFCWQHDK